MTIATALLSMFSLLVLWTAAFVWIPWVTKIYALTRLHEVRDRLYSCADRHPEFRGTDFYRDLEFVYVSTIHLVRDRSWMDVISFIASERARKVDDARAQERAARYLAELADIFGVRFQEELHGLLRDFRRREMALIVRAVFGHPSMASVMAAAMGGIYAWAMFTVPTGVVEIAPALERAPQRPRVPLASEPPPMASALVPA